MAWDFRWLREYSNWMYLGLVFPASIAVGAFLGYLVDRWLGTSPWGMMIGFLFGVISGSISFYRDYQRLTQKKK